MHKQAAYVKDLNDLLDDYKDDGLSESEGVFTINFAKAREKLAQFQLPDPNLLILKFMQAANLAATEVQVFSYNNLVIKFLDWDAAVTLEEIASKLISANLQGGNQPNAHFVTGLSSLMGLCQSPLKLTYECAQTQTRTRLHIGESLEQSVEEHACRRNLLQLESELPKALSREQISTILVERCALYSVPVYFNRRRLKGKLPTTSGAHRSRYFTTNQVLASQVWSPTPTEPESWLPSRPKAKPKSAPQAAWLDLTVDFDPKAKIWLSQAGVLVEHRALAAKYPGVSGVVCADSLETDLTGMQFLDDESMVSLKRWIRKEVITLRDQALENAKGVAAQGQPASPHAYVKQRHSWIGGGIAFIGFILSFYIADPKDSFIFGIVALLVWSVVAAAIMAVLMWFEGGGVDPKTNDKANQHIIDTLKK